MLRAFDGEDGYAMNDDGHLIVRCPHQASADSRHPGGR
jgi:hypothetical protein